MSERAYAAWSVTDDSGTSIATRSHAWKKQRFALTDEQVDHLAALIETNELGSLNEPFPIHHLDYERDDT